MIIELTPEGYTADGKWRLVPVEMTETMAKSMYAAQSACDPGRCDNQRELANSFSIPRYNAAIKAAPLYVTPVSLRYDWNTINPNHNWAATDENGDKFSYPEKPKDNDNLGIWQHYAAADAEKLKTGKECPDWRESLERRPG